MSLLLEFPYAASAKACEIADEVGPWAPGHFIDFASPLIVLPGQSSRPNLSRQCLGASDLSAVTHQSAEDSKPPLIWLGAATVLASLAIQMFVPAMPLIARDLEAGPAILQFGVTAYLIGMGIAQLAVGVMADRRGSRAVLLAGLVVFALGSIGAALTSSAAILVCARLVQSLGGAAAVVTARSWLAEGASGASVTNQMAGLMTITLLSPVVAPVLGGYMAAFLGWRSIFWSLALGAAAIGIHLARQTVNSSPSRIPTESTGRHPYQTLLSQIAFVRLLVGNAGLTVALYTFLTVTPFLLAKHGLDAQQISQGLLLVALSIVIGTICVRYRPFNRRPLQLSKLLIILGAGAMLTLSLVRAQRASSIIGPMCLIGWATGICTPVVMGRALMYDRLRTGSASSLFSATQTLLSAAATAVVIVIGVSSFPALTIAELLSLATAAMFLPRDERGRQ